MTRHNFLDKPAEKALPIKHLALPIVKRSKNGCALHSTLPLSSLEGNVIVLLVLGIDCGTCRHVAGLLSNLQVEYPIVRVIGVCVQTGCGEQLVSFRERAEVRFPLAYCPTRELCPALGIPTSMWLFYPTLIFIDQQQRLRAVFVGKHAFFEDPAANIRTALNELLAEGSEVKPQPEVMA